MDYVTKEEYYKFIAENQEFLSDVDDTAFEDGYTDEATTWDIDRQNVIAWIRYYNDGGVDYIICPERLEDAKLSADMNEDYGSGYYYGCED